MQRWQLQEAKAKLSELIRRLRREGPQEITVHGKPAAVVMSREEFDMLSEGREADSFVEFMRNSPLVGVDLDIDRDTSTDREVLI